MANAIKYWALFAILPGTRGTAKAAGKMVFAAVYNTTVFGVFGAVFTIIVSRIITSNETGLTAGKLLLITALAVVVWVVSKPFRSITIPATGDVLTGVGSGVSSTLKRTAMAPLAVAGGVMAVKSYQRLRNLSRGASDRQPGQPQDVTASSTRSSSVSTISNDTGDSYAVEPPQIPSPEAYRAQYSDRGYSGAGGKTSTWTPPSGSAEGGRSDVVKGPGFGSGGMATGNIKPPGGQPPSTALGGSEPPDVPTVSRRVLEAASRAEPAITDLMQSLAGQTGGKLVGLDYRLKGAESLARKITADMAHEGKTAIEAGKGIKDALRYTLELPETAYSERAKEVVASLRDSGYPVRVKNFWNVDNAVNPYQGINLQVESPDGQSFELQFHTPTSFDTKEGAMHSIYEQWRVLDPNTPEAMRVKQEMTDLANMIPVPQGVKGID